MPAAATWDALPLFPLQAVLYPGGLLNLKVFEARYLDLMSACLRNSTPFGVVALRSGSEVRRADAPVALYPMGTLATIQALDAPQAGILTVRCLGGARIRVTEPRQDAAGLWRAAAQALPDDVAATPPATLQAACTALGHAIEALARQGRKPFAEPYRLDHAGWVAHRWCELLPIPLLARQRLLELDDPQQRLTLVEQFLRGQGVIGNAG
ncbi:MAG: LON peptidase substrate-binding domain-containing protein [Aquabacterium sp.]